MNKSPRTHFSIHIEQKEVLILIGNSGSGKSTLAKGMAKLGIGYGYLGAGDRLRKLLATNSSLAKIINAYTSEGAHVPCDIMMPLMNEWFMEVADYRLVISDAFPRNLEQVSPAFDLFHREGFLKVSGVYVDTPPEKCAHHLLLQAEEAQENGEDRGDSSEQAITKRLATFPEKVKPTIGLLEEKCDRFVRVDTTKLNLKDPLVVRDIALEAQLIH